MSPAARRPPALALLLPLALLAPACSAWRTGDSPLEVDHIKVPHDKHKAAQVDCIACHDEVWDEQKLGESHLPPEAKCLECHGEIKEKGQCDFCHTNVKKAAHWPAFEGELVMSHKAHIERTKEDCAVCHKQLPNPYWQHSMAPPMATCLSCHQHKQTFDAGKCNDCHSDLSHYPLKPISIYSHAPNYVQRHERDARNDTSQCALCHEQTFCSDCHARTVGLKVEIKHAENVNSDYIHRNDFLGRHSIEARFNSTTCLRCHGSSFCESCHALQNVTPDGTNPRDPHPRGFALPGSAQFHGDAARRDIASCAACHDQGPRSNCVTCHSTSGVAGNKSPHPLGWSDRHPRSDISKNGMCLYCHTS